jgi:hypothetical protein
MVTVSGHVHYVDVLSEMVASYDHTVHRTICIPPAEVTWANQTTVSKRLYGRKGPTKSCKFSPGDRVRLSKAKRTFKKRYLPMLLSVMSNGTFCTTTIVRKKAGMHFRACAEHTSGNDVTSGHVTSFRSGPLPVTSLPVTHA